MDPNQMIEKRAFMLVKVIERLVVAQRKFGPMQSPHEGYAVILEEVDELWKEIKDNKRLPAVYKSHMTEEALHVCAMSLRFLIDVC